MSMPVVAASTFPIIASAPLPGRTMMSSTISCQTATKMAAVERMWCRYIAPHLVPSMSEARGLWLERNYDELVDVMFNEGARECRRQMLEFRRDLFQ